MEERVKKREPSLIDFAEQFIRSIHLENCKSLPTILSEHCQLQRIFLLSFSHTIAMSIFWMASSFVLYIEHVFGNLKKKKNINRFSFSKKFCSTFFLHTHILLHHPEQYLSDEFQTQFLFSSFVWTELFRNYYFGQICVWYRNFMEQAREVNRQEENPTKNYHVGYLRILDVFSRAKTF